MLRTVSCKKPKAVSKPHKKHNHIENSSVKEALGHLKIIHNTEMCSLLQNIPSKTGLRRQNSHHIRIRRKYEPGFTLNLEVVGGGKEGEGQGSIVR